MKPRRTPCIPILTMVLVTLGTPWVVSATIEGPYTCTPTDTWHDVYGNATVNGSPVAVGDEVAAFDPDGICCGVFKVTTAGQYGFINVYGDDALTPEDEGAETGDPITFRIWRKSEGKVYVASESLSSWQDMEQTRVDLTADVSLPVELSAFVALEEESKITLRWVTESEVNNLGFHVYRARAADASPTRLTAELIQGSGTSAHRREYVYIDQTPHSGALYYYWIEDITFDGTRQMHGPVVAKLLLPRMPATWGTIKHHMAQSSAVRNTLTTGIPLNVTTMPDR